MRYQFRVWNVMSKNDGMGRDFDLPAWEIFPELRNNERLM